MSGVATDKYAVSPVGYGWARWGYALKQVASHYGEHRLSLTAAGVAFFGFMSLFPAVAAMVFCYGLVADVSQLREHLNGLSAILPSDVVNVLFQRLEKLVSDRNAAGVSVAVVISLAITFWSGSRGVAALVELLGVAYREKDERSFVRSAALSVVLTLGLVFMLIATLFAIAGIPLILEFVYLGSLTETLVDWLRWPIMLVLVCGGVALLYRLAPDRKDARLTWLLPGAIFASVLWGLMSILFSIYVENFGNYDATFGSLSAIVVLLLWLYYSVLIIAIGAELNAELELATRVDTTVGPRMPQGQRGAYVADNFKPVSQSNENQ